MSDEFKEDFDEIAQQEFGNIMAAMAHTHTVFEAALRVGYTEDQAVKIVVGLLSKGQ